MVHVGGVVLPIYKDSRIPMIKTNDAGRVIVLNKFFIVKDNLTAVLKH
jgi:hypothetical protein